jgi:hypothetical protein
MDQIPLDILGVSLVLLVAMFWVAWLITKPKDEE